MRVVATQKGFYERIIEEGEEFDVPDKTKSKWFKPVKGKFAPDDEADTTVKKPVGKLGAEVGAAN